MLKLGGFEPAKTQEGQDRKGHDKVSPAAAASPCNVEDPLCHQVHLSSPVLPEFYLCQEAEVVAPNSVADAQQRHAADLLKRYNQENPQQVICTILCYILRLMICWVAAEILYAVLIVHRGGGGQYLTFSHISRLE